MGRSLPARQNMRQVAGAEWSYTADAIWAVKAACPATCDGCPCEDDAAFRDVQGQPCTKWGQAHRSGQTCAEAGAGWSYTAADVQVVTTFCPVTCETVPATCGAAPAAGDDSCVNDYDTQEHDGYCDSIIPVLGGSVQQICADVFAADAAPHAVLHDVHGKCDKSCGFNKRDTHSADHHLAGCAIDNLHGQSVCGVAGDCAFACGHCAMPQVDGSPLQCIPTHHVYSSENVYDALLGVGSCKAAVQRQEQTCEENFKPGGSMMGLCDATCGLCTPGAQHIKADACIGGVIEAHASLVSGCPPQAWRTRSVPWTTCVQGACVAARSTMAEKMKAAECDGTELAHTAVSGALIDWGGVVSLRCPFSISSMVLDVL